MEVWRTVVYDGVTYENYEVSNFGRVRSLNYKRTGEIKELEQHDNGSGYLRVHLHKNGKSKMCYVHRLVATMFIPNPHNKPTVNHIDENKHNNHVDNLEWATMEEQVHHGTRTERTSKRVRCVETGVIYDSTMEVERQTGLPFQNIGDCCRGKRKTCGKLHWEYVD